MRINVTVEIFPTAEQAESLLRTMEQVNQASLFIKEEVQRRGRGAAGFSTLFRRYYHYLRNEFGLSAQLALSAIKRVVELSTSKRRSVVFEPAPILKGDHQMIRWNFRNMWVSIRLIDGRVRMPFVATSRQIELLRNWSGVAHVVYYNGRFFIVADCVVNHPLAVDIEGLIRGAPEGAPRAEAVSGASSNSKVLQDNKMTESLLV